MYEWGDNKNGELFSKDQSPLITFSATSKLNNLTDIEVKGLNRFYADYEGQSFQKNLNKIEKVYFGLKVHVSQIISSYSFTHFLSSAGQIYSMGENKRGQLGIGRTSSPILRPVVNEFFTGKKEMIESVSVGLSHSVARSKLGYVYMWGCNKLGQVSV